MTTDFQIGENWGDVAAEQADVLDAITDAQRLRLRKGDTLIMLIERRVPPPEIRRIRDALDQLFPENQILVLDCGHAEFVAVGEGPL